MKFITLLSLLLISSMAQALDSITCDRSVEGNYRIELAIGFNPIGEDRLTDFKLWKNGRLILEDSHYIFTSRGDGLRNKTFFTLPLDDISSKYLLVDATQKSAKIINDDNGNAEIIFQSCEIQ